MSDTDIVTRLANAASALDGEHMRVCLAAIDEITTLRHAAADGSLRSLNTELVDALRRLQWVGRDSRCPECHETEDFGHKSTCTVGRALSRATKESDRG